MESVPVEAPMVEAPSLTTPAAAPSFVAVGLALRVDVQGNLEVSSVMPDGGAAVAGITEGDLLVEVDRWPVRGKSEDQVRARLDAGGEGSQVELGVLRPDGVELERVVAMRMRATQRDALIAAAGLDLNIRVNDDIAQLKENYLGYDSDESADSVSHLIEDNGKYGIYNSGAPQAQGLFGSSPLDSVDSGHLFRVLAIAAIYLGLISLAVVISVQDTQLRHDINCDIPAAFNFVVTLVSLGLGAWAMKLRRLLSFDAPPLLAWLSSLVVVIALYASVLSFRGGHKAGASALQLFLQVAAGVAGAATYTKITPFDFRFKFLLASGMGGLAIGIVASMPVVAMACKSCGSAVLLSGIAFSSMMTCALLYGATSLVSRRLKGLTTPAVIYGCFTHFIVIVAQLFVTLAATPALFGKRAGHC